MTYGKLTETGGWVNGWTHHNTPNQYTSGMAVPSGVRGVIFHTMVGNLPGTDAEFMNPGFQASAHFGIAQDGSAIQWVRINGARAWAEEAGNSSWYSVEMADDGNPNIPYTEAQLQRAGQLAELLSRVGNFPLQVTNSTSGEGLGTHNMGGAAWGGHSCPDEPPNHVRSNQRQAIINIAKQIRSGAPAKDYYNVTAHAPGIWKGKVTLTGKGTDGNTWYTSTVNGKTWTNPAKASPALNGTAEFSVSVNPPGNWKGTVVLGGNGTDGTRWHTSTDNGSHWGPPVKS